MTGPGALPALLDPAGPLVDPVVLVDVVDRWLANRRLAENTRAAYRRDLRGWLAWCAAPVTADDGDPLAELHPLVVQFTHVNAYARHLETSIDGRTGRPVAASTVTRKLSAISSWYTFLVNLGVLPRNPVAGADRPEVDRAHSTTVGLAEWEVAALLAAADHDPYPGALRTRALVRFLAVLGARVSDATRTRVGDLATAEGYRTVRLWMKGGKSRRRRLPDAVAAAVDAMLAERAVATGMRVDQFDPAVPLFATASGRPIDRREVYVLVRRLARAAGLTDWEKRSPHSLRHAFVTIARRRGSTLDDVQDAVGHADPRTTRGYDRDRYALDRDPSVLVDFATTPGTPGL